MTQLSNPRCSSTKYPREVGSTTINREGYILEKINEHNWKLQHHIVAEKVLGHELPKGAVIHHVNEIKCDNVNDNLLICQDHVYHAGVHYRLKRLRAGLDPWSD